MAMHNDPICGMQVDDKKASAKSEYQDRTYYFCSADCKRKFDQQPEQYAKTQSQGGGQSSRGATR